MKRFDCPDCGKLLGKTDGTMLESRCSRCKTIVMGETMPIQLQLQCNRCSRRTNLERPSRRPRYCVACGSTSLVPIPTLEPTPRPVPVLVGRSHN